MSLRMNIIKNRRNILVMLIWIKNKSLNFLFFQINLTDLLRSISHYTTLYNFGLKIEAELFLPGHLSKCFGSVR